MAPAPPCPVHPGEAGPGGSGLGSASELQVDTAPFVVSERGPGWEGNEAVQAVSELSLSCPPDEPFSNPLAPDGHDVDDSHSFHQ